MLEGIRELASKYDGFILDQYATAPFKESKIPPTQYIGGDVGARQQCLPSRCRSLSATQCMCADVRPTDTCITSPRYGVMHNGGLPLDGAADCLTSLLDAGKVLEINSNSSSTSEVG